MYRKAPVKRTTGNGAFPPAPAVGNAPGRSGAVAGHPHVVRRRPGAGRGAAARRRASDGVVNSWAMHALCTFALRWCVEVASLYTGRRWSTYAYSHRCSSRLGHLANHIFSCLARAVHTASAPTGDPSPQYRPCQHRRPAIQSRHTQAVQLHQLVIHKPSSDTQVPPLEGRPSKIPCSAARVPLSRRTCHATSPPASSPLPN